ncbi:MAG: FMN-binding negative transcriptional regulator [Gammaproteobacteria bacterium]|nr:FMN-binding negative transcriptional regulator [Gammaproteobacteria bacterium]
MHVPDHFAERRPDELHRIIREHPFGILVTHTRAGPVGRSYRCMSS